VLLIHFIHIHVDQEFLFYFIKLITLTWVQKKLGSVLEIKLHSNSFSPETSENSPVSAQPKLWYEFRKFLSNPKFRSLKITCKIHDPKFRMLIPNWIREKVDSGFCSPGRELWFGLKVGAGDQWTKRPTDWREKISNLDDVRWHIIYWTTPEIIRWKKTKFRIKFIIFSKNETSGFLRLTRTSRGIQPKLPLNNWKFRLIFQNAET
jgi:hypothetical protein